MWPRSGTTTTHAAGRISAKIRGSWRRRSNRERRSDGCTADMLVGQNRTWHESLCGYGCMGSLWRQVSKSYEVHIAAMERWPMEITRNPRGIESSGLGGGFANFSHCSTDAQFGDCSNFRPLLCLLQGEGAWASQCVAPCSTSWHTMQIGVLDSRAT